MKLPVRFTWTVSPTADCSQRLLMKVNDGAERQVGDDMDGDVDHVTVELKEGLRIEAWLRTVDMEDRSADSNHMALVVAPPAIPIGEVQTEGPEPAADFGYEILPQT